MDGCLTGVDLLGEKDRKNTIIVCKWSLHFSFSVDVDVEVHGVVLALAAAQHGYNRNAKVDTYVKSPLPWEYMSNDELPKSYDP